MQTRTLAASAASRPASSESFEPRPTTVCYSVVADANPGMLSRILEPVVKRGLVPDRFDAVREDGDEGPLVIDLHVSRLDAAARDVVASVLSQVVGVHRVLTCEKAG
ncbi:MAG: hypothetical protein RIM33_06705 [Alphaproteobacteria bacterium]